MKKSIHCWTLALLSFLLGCAEQSYKAGPEVYSAPTDHIGDEWIFSSTRINRIDLEVDEDSEG